MTTLFSFSYTRRSLLIQLLVITTASISLTDGFLATQAQHRNLPLDMSVPASEESRLLLTEPAQTAFITAEMRSFLSSALERADNPSGQIYDTKWEMTIPDKLAAKLIDGDGDVINDEYRDASLIFMAEGGGEIAVETLCNATACTFKDGFVNQPGLLSALGSAICYFREAYRTPTNLAACERVGLSDYTVAHHITDMYHHYNFRGAYTKTLAPSGAGDAAARVAVGLEAAPRKINNEQSTKSILDGKDKSILDALDDDSDAGEADECILWSPTTDGVCIHWKSDDVIWREKRFQRIQMEGTKDPRRGGSGTMR